MELVRLIKLKTCRSLCIDDCLFSECVWKIIAQQIRSAKGLKYLSIRQLFGPDITSISKGIEDLLFNIHHCHHLVSLNLHSTNLTGNLWRIIKCSSDETFSNLETLRLTHTKLNICDVTHLFNAIAGKTFPKLKTLQLDGNVLTDCISILQEYCELPPLEKLDLTTTKLSRKDIKALSGLAEQGRLPKLKTLSLPDNPLTDMVADLFGPPDHPGFTVLEELHFFEIHFTQDYLSALANVVRDNKLPALKVLYVAAQYIREQYNCNVDKEMRDLAQSCMTRYRHRSFKLKHYGFKVNTDTEAMLKSLEG